MDRQLILDQWRDKWLRRARLYGLAAAGIALLGNLCIWAYARYFLQQSFSWHDWMIPLAFALVAGVGTTLACRHSCLCRWKQHTEVKA